MYSCLCGERAKFILVESLSSVVHTVHAFIARFLNHQNSMGLQTWSGFISPLSLPLIMFFQISFLLVLASWVSSIAFLTLSVKKFSVVQFKIWTHLFQFPSSGLNSVGELKSGREGLFYYFPSLPSLLVLALCIVTYRRRKSVCYFPGHCPSPTWLLLLRLRCNWLPINSLLDKAWLSHGVQVEILWESPYWLVFWSEKSVLAFSPPNPFSSIPGDSSPVSSGDVPPGRCKPISLAPYPPMTGRFSAVLYLHHWFISTLLWFLGLTFLC